jgi:hypothetical protein
MYSPKVIALIGDPHGTLADRCLPIRMKRKTKTDKVKPLFLRDVEPLGKELHDRLEAWAMDNKERVEKAYIDVKPFDISNDRMAELLMPLQAVLMVTGGEGSMETLKAFAAGLEEHEQDKMELGEMLLRACKEIFDTPRKPADDNPQGLLAQMAKAAGMEYVEHVNGRITFMGTDALISALIRRDEEPWGTCNRGQPITREGLRNLLKPFEVSSKRNKKQIRRGYFRCDFEEAWRRYLSGS